MSLIKSHETVCLQNDKRYQFDSCQGSYLTYLCPYNTNYEITMAYDLKQEEDVKEYIENLGVEYRFGCYKEKKPEVCHLLGDYLEAIKKDFDKAAKVFKSNCVDYKFGKSCLKIGNYCLLGRGKDKSDPKEALTYFEKGCELGEPTACLHAGMLLTATGPNATIQRDVPKGKNIFLHILLMLTVASFVLHT